MASGRCAWSSRSVVSGDGAHGVDAGVTPAGWAVICRSLLRRTLQPPRPPEHFMIANGDGDATEDCESPSPDCAAADRCFRLRLDTHADAADMVYLRRYQRVETQGRLGGGGGCCSACERRPCHIRSACAGAVWPPPSQGNSTQGPSYIRPYITLGSASRASNTA